MGDLVYDARNDDQRKVRFQAYIQTLARGTNAAVLYGLKTVALNNSAGVLTERVAVAQVTEPWLTDPLQPIAYVKCYVHNGVGATSGTLVLHAQEVIDSYTDANGTAIAGWKAAGVKVDVLAAAESAIPITASLTIAPGYTLAGVSDEVEASCAAYVTQLEIDETCIRAELIARIMAVEGVTNVFWTPPGASILASNRQLQPGAFNAGTPLDFDHPTGALRHPHDGGAGAPGADPAESARLAHAGRAAGRGARPLCRVA